MSDAIPLVVEFVHGTWIRQEEPVPSPLPVLRNGQPGTFVVLPSGLKVSLPTDQVVLRDERDGAARVGFGGMSFEGMEEGRFVFWRVRDLLPDELLSPERGDKMLLDPEVVSRIHVRGTQVWPRA